MISLQEGKYAYWSSFTSRPGNNVSLSLAADGLLYLKNSTGSTIKKLSEGGHLVDETNILYRATFDVDGILRLYKHLLGTNGSINITLLWPAISEEARCNVKGTCGPNSYCAIINGGYVDCLCPPGFEYIDYKHSSKGCKSSFSSESDCFTNRTNESYIISVLENTI